MKCPNCKATIEDNSKFCDYCGKEIVENRNTIIKKDEISEEEFQRAFLDKDYNNFQKKFNVYALIFGGPYLYYRKQYIMGSIFILIAVLSMIVTPYLAIVMHVLLSVTFNQEYLLFTNRKTREVKIKNIDKSKEEILSICTEQGKPSILLGLSSIVLIAILIIIVLNIGGTNLKGNRGKTIVKVSDKQIKELLFEVPKEFKSSNYNTETYRAYTYNQDNNYCRIKIETKKKTDKYSTIDLFIASNIYTKNSSNVSNIENTTINSNMWKKLNVENKAKTVTYYVTDYNNSYYIVSYDNYNNNEYCLNEYNVFLNTLNFKK